MLVVEMICVVAYYFALVPFSLNILLLFLYALPQLITYFVISSTFYFLHFACLSHLVIHCIFISVCLFFLYFFSSISVSSPCRAKSAPWGSRGSGPWRGERALGWWDALALQPAQQRQLGPSETWSPSSNACSPCTRWRSRSSWPRWGDQPPVSFISAIYCSCNHWPARGLVCSSTPANQWAIICPVHTT